MVCFGLEPSAAGWKVQTNPLSYGGTPKQHFYSIQFTDIQKSASVFCLIIFDLF